MIVIVVIVVFLAAIHTSINESASLRSSQQAADSAAENEQFYCLRGVFQQEVPKGSTVWVGFNPQSSTNADAEYEQWVATMATLWAVPAPLATAEWAVSITAGNDCNGVSLHVEKL